MVHDDVIKRGPNPQKIRELMRKVRESEMYASKSTKIDFTFGRVMKRGCGTVCCHAGAIANVLIDGEFEHYVDPTEKSASLLYHEGEMVCYEDGMALFTKEIMTEEHKDSPLYSILINTWADANPEIWGNEYGDLMFGVLGYQSFGFDNEEDCTLKAIVEHWEGVADRKEAWDKENGITY